MCTGRRYISGKKDHQICCKQRHPTMKRTKYRAGFSHFERVLFCRAFFLIKLNHVHYLKDIRRGKTGLLLLLQTQHYTQHLHFKLSRPYHQIPPRLSPLLRSHLLPRHPPMTRHYLQSHPCRPHHLLQFF